MTLNELDPSRIPVIVAAKRTPIGKANKGALATARPEDLGALVIKTLMDNTPEVPLTDIDDVIIGCAMPEGSQGLNLGRLIVLRAGFPVEVPAETVNRFCSSGLQTIAQAAMQIMSGMGDVLIAGGVEAMSQVPMTGFKFTANPTLADEMPNAYVGMGITAENVADEFKVSRQAQDEFAARSHKLAAAAIAEGRFDAETVDVEIDVVTPQGTKKVVHTTDEGVRADTTAEGLARLRPVFREGGSVTAGNSSQMSDGAAAVLIMSQAKADEYGLKPLARFVAYAVGGVRPEVMGIGPIVAIPKVLEKAGLKLEDIDLFEINEAFAAQSVAVVNEVGIDIDKVNVNGGAIALGHPLGCTGAKLSTQLIHEMGRRGSKYGMVTMCIGGGMGAAGIFENLQ